MTSVTAPKLSRGKAVLSSPCYRARHHHFRKLSRPTSQSLERRSQTSDWFPRWSSLFQRHTDPHETNSVHRCIQLGSPGFWHWKQNFIADILKSGDFSQGCKKSYHNISDRQRLRKVTQTFKVVMQLPGSSAKLTPVYEVSSFHLNILPQHC